MFARATRTTCSPTGNASEYVQGANMTDYDRTCAFTARTSTNRSAMRDAVYQHFYEAYLGQGKSVYVET